MLGYVSDSELEELYQRASILAFPSLDEGFGMPILDAMARGVPVLTSNVSAMPEVAGDAALLVDPTDVQRDRGWALPATVNSELRDTLIDAGIARAKEFTWEKSVEATWRSTRNYWKRLSAFLFVDRNLQSFQELLVLRRQLDLAGGFKLAPGRGGFRFYRFAFRRLRFVLAVFLAFIESDGCFKNQENIVPGSLDLPDGGSNAIGVGKRFIDRVAKLLHQLFEFLFHALPLSLQRAPS